jgi:exodeoxyribonuclease-3
MREAAGRAGSGRLDRCCAAAHSAGSEKVYTWWSYRAADWLAADRGRRLDHIWVSPALGDRVSDFRITRDARGWERPSDHVPVTAVLDV